MRKSRIVTLAVIAAAFCLAVNNATAENWPGWRGPLGTGVTTETGIVGKWSSDDNVLWKSPLPGMGISNPIIWNDRVVVTASDGYQLSNLHVICLSLKDGRELWHQRLWGTRPTRHHGSKSSMASAAPVTDGRHVFAFFGTGDLFCIELATGGLVWQRSLAAEYGAIENRFAASSSPLLHGDKLLLQCDHYGDSYLLAVDKATGKNVWKVERPERWLSWASPLLVPLVDDKFELVVSGSHQLESFDPDTGKKLWTVDGMSRECIPTPLYAHGMIYAVSGPKGPTLAIKPGGRGNVTESHAVWRNTRGAPFVPSAILVGDFYYLIDDQGIGTCLNAHTGERVWQKRFTGKYTASPIAADGRIYFVNEAGLTTVIQAGVSNYVELARNNVGEAVFASPSIAQRRLFIRTSRHLFCIGTAKSKR